VVEGSAVDRAHFRLCHSEKRSDEEICSSREDNLGQSGRSLALPGPLSLCHSEEHCDEESAVRVDGLELQIPRVARDDNKTRFGDDDKEGVGHLNAFQETQWITFSP